MYVYNAYITQVDYMYIIIHVYYTHTISYALIIRLVIDIGHYQPLFLEDIIDIVISALIMSFHVIKNNKKTFSIKMKEDVGTSKPKKHANKVGRLT